MPLYDLREGIKIWTDTKWFYRVASFLRQFKYNYMKCINSETCLELRPLMSRKNGLFRQLVVPDRFRLHGIQWVIDILRNWKMIFPDRVVFPEGIVPDRFYTIHSPGSFKYAGMVSQAAETVWNSSNLMFGDWQHWF